MAPLFSILPPTLFRPLVSPGARVYADILLALYAEVGKHHQPLSRDLALEMVLDHLADTQSLALTEDALADETARDELETEADAVTARAAAILRYLERTGWLRAENQDDLSRAYTLPDYAFRLLRVLDEIATNQPPPLRGLIGAIHALLQQTLREGNADIYLPEAYRNTLLLTNGLRELQHNIRAHLNQVLEQYQASGVLRQVFTNYRQEIVDRAYHQLRTTDHVSRFRPGVLDATLQLREAPELLAAAQRLFERHEAESTSAGLDQLQSQLRDIRDQFEVLDRLLEAIDTRHSQFVDAAVRKIELQLTASSTASGQLNALLAFLLDESQPVSSETFTSITGPLIQLSELMLLEPQSLASPTRATAAFNPEPEAPIILTDAQIASAQAETLRQMTRAIGRRRVQQFAQELLQGRETMRGAEIPVSSPEDLPLIIYLRAYGDGSLGYRVTTPEEAAWVEHAGVGFRDFVLQASPSQPEDEL